MAIRVDRPRFRGIFGRMRVEAPPAEEFLDAFEDTINEAQDGLATKDELQTEVRTLQERLLRDAAEREARAARQQQVLIGLVSAGFLTLIAIGVAILLAVLL